MPPPPLRLFLEGWHMWRFFFGIVTNCRWCFTYSNNLRVICCHHFHLRQVECVKLKTATPDLIDNGARDSEAKHGICSYLHQDLPAVPSPHYQSMVCNKGQA